MSLEALSDAFARGATPSLERLVLQSNCIGAAGAAAFARALQGGALGSLRVLDLRKNQLGDDGLEALTKPLAAGAAPKLSGLLLASNNIGDGGVEALCRALAGRPAEARTKLVRLSLFGNPIGDAGASALATSFRSEQLPALGALFLGATHIGQLGLQALASAFVDGGGARLQKLRLDTDGGAQADIADAGVLALARAMERGALPLIKDFVVSDGPLGTEHEALKRACDARGIALQ